MEEQKFSISGSFKKTKEYIDTQIELIKLRSIARGSRIFGALVVDITKIVLGLFVLFFWSLALGFYLSEILGSTALGFLATGGIFVLIIILINLLESKLEIKLMDLSIRKILGKWHEEDDHIEEDRMSRMKRKAEEQAEKLQDELTEEDNSNER